MANTFEALVLFKQQLAEQNVNIANLLNDTTGHESTDRILLRFLRARQNDVHEALALLQVTNPQKDYAYTQRRSQS